MDSTFESIDALDLLLTSIASGEMSPFSGSFDIELVEIADVRRLSWPLPLQLDIVKG